MIQSESSSLDTLVYPTQIWLTDQVSTQFDPTFGVILNKSYILNLAKENNVRDIRNLFRLVISHEKMHARQAMQLNAIGRSFQSLNNEEKQVLECQADICAGYLFLFPVIREYSELLTKALLYNFRNSPPSVESVNFPKPDFSLSDSLLTLTSVQRNFEGLEIFFALGVTEGVLGFHTSPCIGPL